LAANASIAKAVSTTTFLVFFKFDGANIFRITKRLQK
jgi:hypothetical protein